MKKYLIGSIATLILFSGLAWAAVSTDYIMWGFGGVNRAKEWVSPDGRMNMSTLYSNASTAVDYWSTPGTLPTTDSYSEITLHRNSFGLAYDERMNISAMVNSDGGSYRFGVEKAGTGQFRDMLFCFENAGGPLGGAYCPFKITPTGAYASSDGGATWHSI